jgi:hypothetical protein
MNRDHVLFQLREAREALDQCIRDIEQDLDYDCGEFVVDMTHLYHHLNTAWNGRDASAEQVAACSEGDFQLWRRFPDTIDMSI